MATTILDNACKKEKDPVVLKRILSVRMVRFKMRKMDMSKAQACRFTAEELNMSESSVYNHLRSYGKHGVEGLRNLPKSGAPSIYPKEVVDAAIVELEQNGRLTPRLLAIKVQEKLPGVRRMSERHARRLLKDRRKSSKKAQHANVAAAKPHKVYYWRTIFFPLILALRALGYTIAVADEMMVSQDANGDAVYWSDISVPVKVPYIGKHDKFAALGITTEPDKQGRIKRCHVAANKANTESFINLLEKALAEVGKMVVIADRASWHNSDDLKRYLESKKGRIILILLPVGSAYLNAKEQDWRQTKLADFYSDYYSSIGGKQDATMEYLGSELSSGINIWKYLVRSPYAYRKGVKRRRKHYGSKGALQYIIDKYADPRIIPNALDIVRKYGPNYICKI